MKMYSFLPCFKISVVRGLCADNSILISGIPRAQTQPEWMQVASLSPLRVMMSRGLVDFFDPLGEKGPFRFAPPTPSSQHAVRL